MRSGIALYTLMAAGASMWNLAPPLGEKPQINPDGFDSATVCSECHQAIHAVWRQSLHSKAWVDPVFQAAYKRTIETFGRRKARLCMSCHAPTVRHTQDYDAAEPITLEGVTCDFCHSVREVALDEPGDSIRLDVGVVKYGPLHKAESDAHKVSSSPLHTRSEFCASCHEYRNDEGVLVLGTYSEWKAGPYSKRGVHCQNCHMPLVPGRVVAANVKDKTDGQVNLHDVSGSHNLEQVRKAVTLKLINTDWMGDMVWVSLEVANVGSGHRFPTGLPMHKAMLEVTLREGGREIARREVPFSIVMVDKTGRRIEREHEVFFNAARVRIDTRIKPEEVRSVKLTFRDIKSSHRLVLGARLFYKYSTETVVDDEDDLLIEPAEMKFLISSVKKTLKPPRR